MNQLATPPLAAGLFRSVDHYRERNIWFPELGILMPDHLHLIVAFSDDVRMAKTIKDWKRFIRRNLSIRFQDGFVDHRIRSQDDHDDQWRYLMNNPVKAGLVDTIDDWPFKRIWKER